MKFFIFTLTSILLITSVSHGAIEIPVSTDNRITDYHTYIVDHVSAHSIANFKLLNQKNYRILVVARNNNGKTQRFAFYPKNYTSAVLIAEKLISKYITVFCNIIDYEEGGNQIVCDSTDPTMKFESKD